MSPAARDNDTAHLRPSSRCCRRTSMTAFLWDTGTASNPAGKVGGLLCFLQPPHFWDDPCFSANSGLANLISRKVSECMGAESERSPSASKAVV